MGGDLAHGFFVAFGHYVGKDINLHCSASSFFAKQPGTVYLLRKVAPSFFRTAIGSAARVRISFEEYILSGI
jgi:hypothetical protein